MRNIPLILAFIFCFSLTIDAVENPVIPVSTPTTQEAQQFDSSNTIVLGEDSGEKETEESKKRKKRRKKKKKNKTVKYIISGVGIVLIAAFWVLTGGEGWNSRQ